VHYLHKPLASIIWCSNAASISTLCSLDADEVHVMALSGQECLKIMSSHCGATSSIDIELPLADVKHDCDPDSEQHVIIVDPWCEPQHRNFQFSSINYETISRCASVAAVGDEAVSILNECQDKDSEESCVAQ